MSVPYTFATATTSIPLSQLDSNFATPVTIGNVAIQLGNTVTTIGNLTLTNVTANLTAGSIDNVPIGATTPSNATFVTINASNANLSNITSNVAFTSNGAVYLPTGNTAQRPSAPVTGAFRYNTTSNSFEGYNGTIWGGVGGAQANGVIQINNTVVSTSYTIASGQNGLSVGPVTINSGVTVNVSSGQRWVVL
jgi:hypothetical protein